MSDLAKNLARKLRQLRGDATQRAFARRLGLEQATLNRVEQCRENITLRTIQKMCGHLKCSAGWLLDGNDQVAKPSSQKVPRIGTQGKNESENSMMKLEKPSLPDASVKIQIAPKPRKKKRP